jgi:hypothetical protein
LETDVRLSQLPQSLPEMPDCSLASSRFPLAQRDFRGWTIATCSGGTDRWVGDDNLN